MTHVLALLAAAVLALSAYCLRRQWWSPGGVERWTFTIASVVCGTYLLAYVLGFKL